MTRRNILLVMSDEHLRTAAGCYGSPIVETPAIDALASRGVRFANAYTPSPICVPARAALATGRYPHQTGFWSNAQAYDGAAPSWAHRLRDAGYRVNSIGKLHYRGGDDYGFEDPITPMHVRNGTGWVRGLLRRELRVWDKVSDFAAQTGAGECDYTHFDRAVCENALHWIAHEAAPAGDRPWALFVSFVSPHYPLIVPGEYFDRYPVEQMALPALTGPDAPALHPVVDGVRRFLNYDAGFDDDRRRVAVAAYYGLCTFVDDLIGKVIGALDRAGRRGDTLVVYTSDHGECLGKRAIWTKCVMYEESAAVPMVIAGPGVGDGCSSATPVSLIDLYPTIIEAAGVARSDDDADMPGRSLLSIAALEDDPERTILSEYHDGGSITGMFMTRCGRWKYMHYPGYAPELYDLEADPDETHDLAASDAHRAILARCERRLRSVVDPDAANERAFADQAALIARLGGIEAILATDDYDFTPSNA